MTRYTCNLYGIDRDTNIVRYVTLVRKGET